QVLSLPERRRLSVRGTCRKSFRPDGPFSHDPPEQRYGVPQDRGGAVSFFSEERAAELRDLFFESAQELLQALNEQGLELEKSPGDTEVIRGIRRTIHTLKGDSAACGFKELSELAHELEDALKPELAATAGNALAELVLSSAD